MTNANPTALITGVSRRLGIGAAIARALAADGWNVATTHYQPYDHAGSNECGDNDAAEVQEELRGLGARTCSIEADLSDPDAPARVFDEAERSFGPVSALALAHTYWADGNIDTTTVASFDRHLAVNVRATWLLIREFGRRFSGAPGSGRIVSLTSDHTAGNLPYGMSKGAMDRIVLASATEFAGRGITANAINPGGVDNGWMNDEIRDATLASIPLRRVGTPRDAANLVRFLCSPEGGWINGQLLTSDGGQSL